MITQTNQKTSPTKFVSLAQLVQQTQPYEHMPVHLQEALQRTVWWTLGTEIAAILVALLLPKDFLLNGVSGDFFLLGIDQWVNALLHLVYDILPYLLAINAINLCITLAILAISRLMTQPVHEPLHWLVAIQPIPTGISALSVAGLGVILALMFVVVLAIWAVIIAIGLAVLVGMLSAA